MASFNQKTLNTSSRSIGFSGLIKSWICSSSYSSRSWVNLSSGGLDCTFVRDWWIGWRDQILLGIVGKWNCDGLIKLLHNTTPPPPPRVLARTRLIHRKTVAKMMPKIDQNHFSSESSRNKNPNNEMVQMEIFAVRWLINMFLITLESLHIYSLDIELGRGYSSIEGHCSGTPGAGILDQLGPDWQRQWKIFSGATLSTNLLSAQKELIEYGLPPIWTISIGHLALL